MYIGYFWKNPQEIDSILFFAFGEGDCGLWYSLGFSLIILFNLSDFSTLWIYYSFLKMNKNFLKVFFMLFMDCWLVLLVVSIGAPVLPKVLSVTIVWSASVSCGQGTHFNCSCPAASTRPVSEHSGLLQPSVASFPASANAYQTFF